MPSHSLLFFELFYVKSNRQANQARRCPYPQLADMVALQPVIYQRGRRESAQDRHQNGNGYADSKYYGSMLCSSHPFQLLSLSSNAVVIEQANQSAPNLFDIIFGIIISFRLVQIMRWSSIKTKVRSLTYILCHIILHFR